MLFTNSTLDASGLEPLASSRGESKSSDTPVPQRALQGVPLGLCSRRLRLAWREGHRTPLLISLCKIKPVCASDYPRRKRRLCQRLPVRNRCVVTTFPCVAALARGGGGSRRFPPTTAAPAGFPPDPPPAAQPRYDYRSFHSVLIYSIRRRGLLYYLCHAHPCRVLSASDTNCLCLSGHGA